MCSMNKKEHILENLGQFEDETPLQSMQVQTLEREKGPKKSKRAFRMCNAGNKCLN